MAGSRRVDPRCRGGHHPHRLGGRHEQARERLLPSDHSHDAVYGVHDGGRGDGQDGCRDRRPCLGVVRHRMRAGAGIQHGKEPDYNELEGKRPPAVNLGYSGVERASGLWMGLRR